jgi:hypothetical protein
MRERYRNAAHDSFAQYSAIVDGHNATVAAEDEHVARYLCLYC